jgi:glycerol kinase
VVDATGAIRGAGQREFTQLFPQPGWVEHDPDEIWDSQLHAARAALENAGVRPADIAAIGITNQRETTLVWDRQTGLAFHNAIVWQDRRTADLCKQLAAAGHERAITAKTGLLLDPYFSGTKLRWLLDHVPAARAAADQGRLCFGTIDSWLMWKLCGVHLTDVTNASRTLLFNIHTSDWDPELLGLLGIPREALPKVVASCGLAAQTQATWLECEIPVAGIAGDQQAALFGQACFSAGAAKNTYGTGCFMLMHTGERPVMSQRRLLTTAASTADGSKAYALEGSVFMAGAAVQWLRDGLGIIRQAHEVEALAAQVADTGGVYLVPAFTGLGAPHWDPSARGLIIGLTRGTEAAHIARATLEGIAYQSAEVLTAMQADAGIEISRLQVDGGVTRNDLLMQFQADVLGVPVVRPRIFESTAMGAAFLAGLGIGFWKDPAELAARREIDRVFEPAMSRDRAETLLAGWRKAVDRAKDWAEA